MKQKRIITIVLGITLIFGGLGLFQAADASAQQLPFQYAVKFVCGKATKDAKVVKGLYATAINVHNPFETTIRFFKKAVIAFAEGQPQGPISLIKTDVLIPDGALEVDCTVIRRQLFVGADGVPLKLPALIKGFVVIKTATELDVVAVYTARHRRNREPDGDIDDVESIDVEYIQPRRMPTPPPPP